LENFQAGWRVHGGRVIGATITKPDGSQRSFSFNSRGRPLSSVNSVGQQTAFKYDSVNRLTDGTDALNRTFKFVYDGQGNVTQRVDPLGRVVDYAYDGRWNKVTSVTRYLDGTGAPGPDSVPIVYQFQYSAQHGGLISSTDPLQNTVTRSYAPNGQLASITVPGDRTTAFAYNAAGNLAVITDPLGNETRFESDGAGRRVATTNALGYTSRSEYNGSERVTATTDELNQVTRFNRDTAGRLSSVVNPLNQAIESYSYDGGDRVKSRTDALNKSTLYDYDLSGRLIRTTDRRGQVTTFVYDAQGKLVRIDYPESTQTRAYDFVGRLTEVREGASVIGYAYDSLNRLVRETTDGAAGRHEVGYEYDTLDRVVRRTVDGGDATTYTYDNASRPITITYRNQVTTYTWDNASRLIAKTLPDGIKQELQYDDADRLLSIAYKRSDGTVIETIAYTYDAKGQRISKSSAITSIQETPITAGYDAANRLTSLTLTATGQTFTLAYDDNGNLASKTDQVDPSNVTIYTWDARNRLKRIDAPGLTASFEYDAFGRRVSRTVNGQTRGYLYNGWQAIGEIAGGNIDATLLTTLAVDDVVARYTQAGARTYLTDALGSVLALAKDDQSIQAFFTYTPYGEVQVLGDDEGNPIQYTARENDRTGLYFYRARYYDPVLKRFISEDPIGIDGDLNVSAYVGGNPINFTDPEGLAPGDKNFGINDSGFWKWWEQNKYDYGPFSTNEPGFNPKKPHDIPNKELADILKDEYEQCKTRDSGRGGKTRGGKFRGGRGGGRGSE